MRYSAEPRTRRCDGQLNPQVFSRGRGHPNVCFCCERSKRRVWRGVRRQSLATGGRPAKPNPHRVHRQQASLGRRWPMLSQRSPSLTVRLLGLARGPRARRYRAARLVGGRGRRSNRARRDAARVSLRREHCMVSRLPQSVRRASMDQSSGCRANVDVLPPASDRVSGRVLAGETDFRGAPPVCLTALVGSNCSLGCRLGGGAPPRYFGAGTACCTRPASRRAISPG